MPLFARHSTCTPAASTSASRPWDRKFRSASSRSPEVSRASSVRASGCSPVASGDSSAPSTARVPHSPRPTTRTWGNGPGPRVVARIAELRAVLGGGLDIQAHAVDRHQPHPCDLSGLLLLPGQRPGHRLQQPLHHLPAQPLARLGHRGRRCRMPAATRTRNCLAQSRPPTSLFHTSP